MSLRPGVTKLEELRGKLYSKAKTEPTFRFYSLYDNIHRWDVLTEALRLSRERKGAPGVDGQTFDQIREYGEEQWLQELQRELQARTYRPLPVRRVLIPKPGGGERPLGIPTIRDRVAQTAAKLLLEPIFEADLCDTAYGYVPGVEPYKRCRRSIRNFANAEPKLSTQISPDLRHDSPSRADDMPCPEDCG